MIASALILTCALSLQGINYPWSFPRESDRNAPGFERDMIIREYKWITDLLKDMYPDNDFLILPKEYENTPPGWIWVPLFWRSHIIYRRPLKEAA